MSSPERRLTKFPGSSPASSLGKRQFETASESRLSASKLPKVPKFLQGHNRTHPPAIPLKVNPNSQQFLAAARSSRNSQEAHHQRSPICQKGSPWQEYYGILTEDQAGSVTLAYKQEIEHPIFAVKEINCKDSTSANRLLRCAHDNIVGLYDAYLEHDRLYLVYECLPISLAELQSTRFGRLAAFQIAAVCRDLVHGIQYIHKELRILHGAISAENVMISKNGSVKLANIGQSMLEHTAKTGNEQQDFRALGLLMVHLMELGTSLRDPKSFTLHDPDKWEEPIKNFLQKTQQSTGDELQKDVFLEHSPSSQCLKPLVEITERSIHRSWDICMK